MCDQTMSLGLVAFGELLVGLEGGQHLKIDRQLGGRGMAKREFKRGKGVGEESNLAGE